ncbi:hypothetical protein THUN1379_21040 [Paludibacterium sp. THUN1379]|uniref:hypothetical protein n=1 Tax=Paludibacterium sp. THUN1379 TaxID=3112107 RepID=UPI0030914E4F|nr:hypothetical protein THUN1379_21040 [Paludibacterium sp. THUN1379]
MKESDLQIWFEERLADETLHKHITNENSLLQRWRNLNESRLEAEFRTRVWVNRALKALNALCNSDKILANQSMHVPGEPQKRPDFLLQSHSGEYTLVELKANRGAERQGIQELLAYSAELHQQVPFLVGVFLVMVARDWDELLTKASKGALLTGAYLLPLRVLGDLDRGIRLEINLDILRAPAPTPIYAPHALTPYILARYTKNAGDTSRTVKRLDSLSQQVRAKCKEVAQTGFVCVWCAQSNQNDPFIIGITLFSADPNWMFGDDASATQEFAELAFHAQPSFMRRVLKKSGARSQSTNPSFYLMEDISKREQADLDLEWGHDGGTFAGYIDSVTQGFSCWHTLSVRPFGTMQDFWRAQGYDAYQSFTAYQLKQLVMQFDEYHAGLYGPKNGR